MSIPESGPSDEISKSKLAATCRRAGPFGLIKPIRGCLYLLCKSLRMFANGSVSLLGLCEGDCLLLLRSTVAEAFTVLTGREADLR